MKELSYQFEWVYVSNERRSRFVLPTPQSGGGFDAVPIELGGYDSQRLLPSPHVSLS